MEAGGATDAGATEVRAVVASGAVARGEAGGSVVVWTGAGAGVGTGAGVGAIDGCTDARVLAAEAGAGEGGVDSWIGGEALGSDGVVATTDFMRGSMPP